MDFTDIYETVIYRVARGTGLQHADALDVVQEVFAKVFRKIGDWDSDRRDGRFRNWIHRLTVNASIDVIRRHSRHVTASGDSAVQYTLEQVATQEDATTLFQLEHRRVLFHHVAEQVRATVSKIAWGAFWMTTIEDQQPADVAKQLELTVGSVYAHKCRVLAKIRQRVEQLAAEASNEV